MSNLTILATTNKRPGIKAQREIIITAAIMILNEKSFESTSVQDILEKAGVSRQTFYRCFKNKTDIYHEVFRIGNLFISESLKHFNRDQETAKQAANRIIGMIIKAKKSDIRIIRSTYRETLRPDSEFIRYRDEILDLVTEELYVHSKKVSTPPQNKILIRAIVLACEQLIYEFSALKTFTTKKTNEYQQSLEVLLKVIYMT